jgi:hypothetical protein
MIFFFFFFFFFFINKGRIIENRSMHRCSSKYILRVSKIKVVLLVLRLDLIGRAAKNKKAPKKKGCHIDQSK